LKKNLILEIFEKVNLKNSFTSLSKNTADLVEEGIFFGLKKFSEPNYFQ